MSDVKVSECCLCCNLRACSCQPGAHFSNYSNSTWTWRVSLTTEEPDVAFRGWWRTNRDKYSESTIKKTLTLSILITLNSNLHPGLRQSSNMNANVASKYAFEVYNVSCFILYCFILLCYFLYLLVLPVSDWPAVYLTLTSCLCFCGSLFISIFSWFVLWVFECLVFKFWLFVATFVCMWLIFDDCTSLN